MLQRVDALPTLSPVAARLLAIGSSEDVDLNEIVAVIESDPALTARILGLCRRSTHGLGDRVGTVRRAIIMLGVEAVQSSVLSVCVYDAMNAPDPPNAETEEAGEQGSFDRAGFWKHAAGAACAAELLAERARGTGVRPDEAFTAGLVHGVGRLAMDLVLPGAYRRVLAVAERRGCDSAAVERAVIGIDHHTAGRRIAERWGLPDALRDVMWLYAQTPASLPAGAPRSLIGIVRVATALCREMHIGWSGDFGPPPSSAEACRQAGLDPGVIEAVAARLHEAASRRFQVLGLDDRPTPQLLLQSIANANRRLGDLYASAERRARQAHQHAAALGAVEAFLADPDTGQGPLRTLGALARSAVSALGPTRWSALLQQGGGEPWLCARFGASGRVEDASALPAPASSELDSAVAAGGRNVPPIPAAALGACGLGSQPRTAVRVCRAGAAHPVCLLLSDEAPTAPGPPPGALVAAWAGALDGAARHALAQRVGEELAEVNRSLVEAQGRLAEANALAHLGEVTAGAAHEMNNPLTVIRGRSQLLARRLADPSDRGAAEAIASAAADLSDLITALHLLAAPPELSLEAVSLEGVLAAAVEEVRRRTGVSPGLELDLGGTPPAVEADRELLVLALSEVICNAVEAAPGAPLTVRAQTEGVDGRLLLRIIDQGPGMSAKASRHAFDPFFSEKPAGRQTGLGLTRARRIVELHGGEISLRSEPGRGTTATIALPMAAVSGGGVASGPRGGVAA